MREAPNTDSVTDLHLCHGSLPSKALFGQLGSMRRDPFSLQRIFRQIAVYRAPTSAIGGILFSKKGFPMRLCRFGDGKLGLVKGGIVRDVSAALAVLPAFRYPFPAHDVFIENIEKVMEAVNKLAAEAPSVPLDAVQLHSPVANP